MSQHGTMSPFPRAPEICVEIISPSSVAAEITEKTRAYLRFIDRSAEKAQSGFPVSVTLPPPMKGYP